MNHHKEHQHTEPTKVPVETIGLFEEKAAALTPKQIRSQQAQARRDKLDAEKAEKKRERDTKTAATAKKRQDTREAAAKERFERAAEARRVKADEVAAERERTSAQREQEAQAAKAGRDAEKRAERAEAATRRAVDREAAKQKRKSDKVKARMRRDEENQRRKEELQARKDAKTSGERRPRATHVHLNATGLTAPQEYSVRGQVLKYIVTHHKAGDTIPIAELADKCKDILYGLNIRSALNKLDETGHLDMIRVEETPLAKTA